MVFRDFECVMRFTFTKLVTAAYRSHANLTCIEKSAGSKLVCKGCCRLQAVTVAAFLSGQAAFWSPTCNADLLVMASKHFDNGGGPSSNLYNLHIYKEYKLNVLKEREATKWVWLRLPLSFLIRPACTIWDAVQASSQPCCASWDQGREFAQGNQRNAHQIYCHCGFWIFVYGHSWVISYIWA